MKTQPPLGLIQDYQQLNEHFLMRYYILHSKERDWIQQHPEQYVNDPNALNRELQHLNAIKVVATERGIELEQSE